VFEPGLPHGAGAVYKTGKGRKLAGIWQALKADQKWKRELDQNLAGVVQW
jgi:hypothetical protein